MKLNKSYVFLALIISLASCVATVGPSISLPKIPAPVAEMAPFLAGKTLAVGSMKDLRTLDYNTTGQGLVTPGGDVSRTVETAVGDYFKSAGANLDFNAPVAVSGEVREWQSAYEGSTTGSLNSTATIYIEVINQSSKMKIFSGTFTGTRSSHFPIVRPADIKDSLGFAMVQAIEQIMKDQGFVNALSSF